jgi:serine/threonine protein kinase
MAALTTHPKYVTTAGFGCIFSNFGLGPGEPEEPTIVTKFFSKNDYDNDSDAFFEEKLSHRSVINRCGNFATMNSIFGVDLNAFRHTFVKGYPTNINVKGPGGVITKTLEAGYADVAPSIICETPNYKGASLRNRVYSTPDGATSKYPVVKMNNMGVDLFDNPGFLTLNSFIQSLELMVVFHTGMIHNDMKGNNMLVSPLTGKVSLIDFGLCKKYEVGSDYPPYHDRTYTAIQQSWYAYPPEYTFLRTSRTEFRAPTRDYVGEFLNSYDRVKASMQWPFHIELEHEAGESDDARITRITRELTTVYNEYFDPALPGRLSNDYIFLQTAITGDTYTLGLEAFFCYGEAARRDGLDQHPSISATDVRVSAGKTMTGNIFIVMISMMLTAFNPRYRPFHVNILKLYRHYNRRLIQGATTIISAGGTHYAELSILNGAPAVIDVDPEMCLGMDGCPISEEDVKDNLKLLYLFLQQDPADMTDLLYNDTNTYESLLRDANTLIRATAPSLFFPPPPLPPVVATPPAAAFSIASTEDSTPTTPPGTPPDTPPGGPPTVPTPPGAPATVATPPPDSLPHFVTPRSHGVAAPMPPAVAAAFAGLLGSPRVMPRAHVPVRVIHPFFRRAALPPLGPHAGGTNPYEILIYVSEAEAVVKNLIEAGLLSPGVYMSALKKASDDVISKTLRSILIESEGVQKGGLTSPLKPIMPRAIRIRNRNTKSKKLNGKGPKLNATRRLRANVNIQGKMPIYSDDQTGVFFNQIMTSTTPGRLNLLYSYYVSHLPVPDQKTVMSLLFFAPLANPEVIGNVLTQLASSDSAALIDYLKGLKADHVSEVGASLELDVAKAEAEVDTLVAQYIDGGDARYMGLLNKFTEMSDAMVKLTSS